MPRCVIAGLSALLLALATAMPMAEAQVSVAADGKRKINLAGRQRMLSQRMAKAACFVSLGENVDGHLTMLGDAYALFDLTLKGLRHGDADLQLNVEHQPDILEGLSSVDGLWDDYSAALSGIMDDRSVSHDQLNAVVDFNLPTLKEMNRTVGLFERKYGSSGEIHPALALAINISGRQRMLTQKASKEFCLIAHGVKVEANREALSETLALFHDSLNNLIHGSDELGLPEAPTDELLVQLETVQRLWLPLKDIFEATAAGSNPTPAEVARVAEQNNPLLVEMNKAVQLYEAL